MRRPVFLAVAQIITLLFVTNASAQIEQQVLPRLRDLLRKQIDRLAPPPTHPAVPNIAQPTPTANSTGAYPSQPTFDCTKAKSLTAQILCSGQDGAEADWLLTASAWAYSADLDAAAQKQFSKAEDDWRTSLKKSCKLTSQISAAQHKCVIDAYHQRARALQTKMSADALAEINLGPGQRQVIQKQLVTLGLLADEPDG